jgi:serine protease inhibitor
MLGASAGVKVHRERGGRLALLAGVLVLVGTIGAGICGVGVNGVAQAKAGKHPATSKYRGMGPAAATAELGLDLLRAIPRGNAVVSPDSIATALAMTGTGAAGPTAREIARTLHLKGARAFKAVGRLQRRIIEGQAAAQLGKANPPTLSIANGLFAQAGLAIQPPFVSGLERHFGAAPESLDFIGDLDGSREAINRWSSDHTDGLVPHPLDSLPKWTRLALANSVLFKGAWLDPFEPAATKPGLFRRGKARTTVPFMHQTERLQYASGRGYKAVALPYAESGLSMLIVLPTGQPLGRLQGRLDATALNRIARSLGDARVELSLPRFHVSAELELKEMLKELGMSIPFSEEADFSRITGDKRLKIGQVTHAADLAVDEAGTVAAATAIVVLEVKSKPRRVEFNANRPFLFFLRDENTGTVLFAGRVTNPA